MGVQGKRTQGERREREHGRMRKARHTGPGKWESRRTGNEGEGDRKMGSRSVQGSKDDNYKARSEEREYTCVVKTTWEGDTPSMMTILQLMIMCELS